MLILKMIAVCFVKSSGKKWTDPSNVIRIIYFSILVAVGYTSVVVTIINVINGKA